MPQPDRFWNVVSKDNLGMSPRMLQAGVESCTLNPAIYTMRDELKGQDDRPCGSRCSFPALSWCGLNQSNETACSSFSSSLRMQNGAKSGVGLIDKRWGWVAQVGAGITTSSHLGSVLHSNIPTMALIVPMVFKRRHPVQVGLVILIQTWCVTESGSQGRMIRVEG